MCTHFLLVFSDGQGFVIVLSSCKHRKEVCAKLFEAEYSID